MRRQRAKTNKVLALAISELDPKDPLQLDRISELYLAIGSTRKAADYLASAKNRAGGLAALETLKKRR
ncbi:hypothetical protein L0152_22165, partial [bacterium]|nr:hypothetical protein [bacterium]